MDNENLLGHAKPEECKCRPVPKFIETTRLARAYVPLQKMCEIYSPEKGLRHGTIYPELCMPYEPRCHKCDDDGKMMF